MNPLEKSRAVTEAGRAVAAHTGEPTRHERALQQYLIAAQYRGNEPAAVPATRTTADAAATASPAGAPAEKVAEQGDPAPVECPPGAVVVGLDGSAGSRRAAAWAADEASRRHAPLALVHAYRLPAAGGFPAGMWLFDPEVFIDDDGQGYLYFGGNSQIGTAPNVQGPQNPKSTRVVKLKDDMVTLDGDPVEIDAPGMFEASSLFKRGDTYYYSYSSNFQVNEVPGQYPSRGAIAYMMTDDPMDLSASTYAGVAFQNQSTFFGAGNGGNNHSDMFTYKGETYFTYHAQTRGAAWAAALGTPGSTQGYRSVHIDKLEFNEDGTIKPVTGTRAGVSQVESFDPYRTFEAETLAWQLGLTTVSTDEA